MASKFYFLTGKFNKESELRFMKFNSKKDLLPRKQKWPPVPSGYNGH